MRVSRLSELGARSCRVHLAQHVRGGPETAGTQDPIKDMGKKTSYRHGMIRFNYANVFLNQMYGLLPAKRAGTINRRFRFLSHCPFSLFRLSVSYPEISFLTRKATVCFVFLLDLLNWPTPATIHQFVGLIVVAGIDCEFGVKANI